MYRMTVNDAGQVDYRTVVNALNWRHREVFPPHSGGTAVGPGGLQSSSWPQGDESSSSQLVRVVRADALMQDLSA